MALEKTGKELLDGLISGLKWSLILSPIGVVWCGLTWKEPKGYEKIIVFGIILGLIFALLIGLIRGLRGAEIETKTVPNQGIWISAFNAGIITLVSWLILFPIIYKWFPQGVQSKTSIISWGLILGLLFGGGISCIQHLNLRLILWINGFIPSNLARFLDYASERIFMQKVGGGYIFIHRMLLEHFATRIQPTQSEIRNTNQTIKVIFIGGIIIVASLIYYHICSTAAEYQLRYQAIMREWRRLLQILICDLVLTTHKFFNLKRKYHGI
jgi:hypothetical protein